MIARHETHLNKDDIWSALSAPLPPGVISWRQDGRPIARDGRHIARFVAYIEANTVRERLDAVVPGEWDLTLEPLPLITGGLDEDANMGPCNFKAKLQILGVIREDCGTGKDWKQASTDAFKRVAVRFGVGHELYAYEQNWVQMDGDGKYAKPVEDPAVAYARRYGRPRKVEDREQGNAAPPSASSTASSATAQPTSSSDTPSTPNAATATGSAPLASDEPSCPKCGSRMWDNRLTKRNPKAPDYKCRDRSCDGVIWPPKEGAAQPTKEEIVKAERQRAAGEEEDLPF
jgi:hypothetical protein